MASFCVLVAVGLLAVFLYIYAGLGRYGKQVAGFGSTRFLYRIEGLGRGGRRAECTWRTMRSCQVDLGRGKKKYL